MEEYVFKSCDEALEVIKEIKEKNRGRNVKLMLFTFNFEDDENGESLISPDEGCILVNKSETIILNKDDFYPHMQLFSKKQTDIENIKSEGIMHDIILNAIAT